MSTAKERGCAIFSVPPVHAPWFWWQTVPLHVDSDSDGKVAGLCILMTTRGDDSALWLNKQSILADNAIISVVSFSHRPVSGRTNTRRRFLEEQILHIPNIVNRKVNNQCRNPTKLFYKNIKQKGSYTYFQSRRPNCSTMLQIKLKQRENNMS